MDHPFRTAAFGGFNREDVLNYLEEHSRQANQKQAELQQQLGEASAQMDTLRREGEELRSQAARLQKQLDDMVREQQELKHRLEESNRELSTSRTNGTRMAQELETVLAERDSLQKKLEAMTPDAQAYTLLKERTAGVELEAHQRAQSIQEQAEQEAKKVRRQVEQWLQGVQREYEELCSQVESTVSHAAEELGRANACLERAGELMGEQSEAFEAITRAYEVQEHAKVQAPMPIEE